MTRILKIFLLVLITEVAVGQVVPVPDSYSIVDSVKGDLDKDGVSELVVAYNTFSVEKDSLISIPRQLVIYKLNNGKWTHWKKSDKALLGSQDGGIMGDPFGEIEIQNGILLISHFGGSSWKWGFTDKYRLQNSVFYLIGFTSTSGKPCESWKDVDYNLSTGKMIVKVFSERCSEDETDSEDYDIENEEFYKKGIIITLQNKFQKEIEVHTPKYGHVVYIGMETE